MSHCKIIGLTSSEEVLVLYNTFREASLNALIVSSIFNVEIFKSLDINREKQKNLYLVFNLKSISEFFMKYLFLLCLLGQIAVAQSKRYRLVYENEITNAERFDKMDIKAYNEMDNLHLYGTLLKPKVAFEKVVVLVPGSGADSRENHFKLAEILLLNNIAVFRYDERGVFQSEGEYGKVSYTINEMGEDLAVLFHSLRHTSSLEDKKIGFIAHSMGGMAVLDAIDKKRVQPDFLVQWASPVQSFGEFFKYQLKNGLSGLPEQFKYENLDDAYKIMDIFNQIIASSKDTTNLKQDRKLSNKAYKIAKKQGYTKKRHVYLYYGVFPEQKAIIKKDFERMYSNLQIPTLYIIGTADIYADPIAGVEKLRTIDNHNIEIHVFENLNHYLTTDPNLVQSKEMYDIAEVASSAIINWISTSGVK